MIDGADVRLYIPPGLKGFKQDLFDRVGAACGGTIRHDLAELAALPANLIPAVGCTPALKPLIEQWQAEGRRWIYWDRGYARRVFATWLPRGANGGYYRWHLDAWQMTRLRAVPDDRWKALGIPVEPWKPGGRHIVVIDTLPDYWLLRGIEGWAERTVEALRAVTDRPIRIRAKETTTPLQHDLHDAHALVSHGSIAAVGAAILGCPVFVDPSSAAALVGRTDIADIESPAYPDRQPWLNSLAYCQFNEAELVDGTLWRLIE